MKKIFLFLFAMTLCNSVYANIGWIPAQSVPSYPIVETPSMPTQTYSTYIIPTNTTRYQWIPIYVNKPVVINTWGILCKKQQIIYQPQIEWVLQPIYYR